MEKSPIYSSYTVVIAGNSGTGKTSLVTRMSKGVFAESRNCPIAGFMTPVMVTVGGMRVRLMIWDTSSDDDYRDMTNGHFANAQACVFVYAVDEQASFDAIFSVWSRALEDNSSVPHITFIVGNKTDIPEAERTVRVDTAEKTLPIQPVYVSCVDGTGVPELLDAITAALIETFPKKVPDGDQGATKRGETDKNAKTAGGGCGCELL
jgi:small GTP-binding protein